MTLDTATAPRELSLSEYLHKQLEVLVTCPKSASSKIDVARRLGAFINEGCLPTTGIPSTSASSAEPTNRFHSPIASDAFVTLQGAPVVTDPSAKRKPSGIQFPPIVWNSNFRKGYTLLVWIRIRGGSGSVQDSASATKSTASNIIQRQLVYRFSTPTNGIQAVIELEGNITTLLVESIPRPTVPVSPSSQFHASSLRIPIPTDALPVNEWILLSIQHTFPYLKRPFLVLHIDGEEIGRGEIAYPDSVEYMTDVLFLANWEKDLDVAGMGLYQDTMGSLILDTANNNNSSSNNNTNAYLKKKMPPSMLQGLVYENGPLTGYGGAIIPVIPSVVQARDAVVIDEEATLSNNKNRKVVNPTFTPNPTILSGGAGRGLGMPLSVGPNLPAIFDRQLSYGGIFHASNTVASNDASSPLTLQRLLAKMILGWSAAEDAMIIVGDGMTKVFLRLKIGSSLGNMNELPKVGLVQPQEPETASSSKNLVSVLLKKKADDIVNLAGDSDSIFAKCVGNATLCHVSMDFLTMEYKVQRDIEGDVFDPRTFPSYYLPAFGTFVLRPIPRFVETFYSINPVSYILLPFHQALPHPGYAYSFKHDYYRRSFKHLYDLVVYDGAAFAARLIELLAASISLGGKIREDILQQGVIHSLATLLRRVLLRASRLDIFTYSDSSATSKTEEALIDALFRKYSSLESSDSEFSDFTSTISSRPVKVPPKILQACCTLTQVLMSHPGRTFPCGSSLRPSIGVYLRRTSDLAISTIFGFVFDLDLWGGDYYATSVMLKQFTDIFFPEETPIDRKDHDIGLSWLVRGQLSVKYFLDLMRTYFSNDALPDVEQALPLQEKTKAQGLLSIAQSLSRLMYNVLLYSLSSKALQACEHDIHALVKALCTCPLGSLGAHVILISLRNVLQFCEVVRAQNEKSESCQDCRLFLDQITETKGAVDSKSSDMKKIKTEMVSRLARSLLVGQFHDIVAPIILSRTVFDGRSNSSISTASKFATGPLDVSRKLSESQFSWPYHWRTVLLTFVVSAFVPFMCIYGCLNNFTYLI